MKVDYKINNLLESFPEVAYLRIISDYIHTLYMCRDGYNLRAF